MSRRLRWSIALSLLVLLGAACPFIGDAVWQSLPGPARRADRIEWGLYQIYWGRIYPEKLAQTLEAFASPPDYVMFYRDLGRPFPQFGIDSIAEQGATPIISLELWSWHDRSGRSYLPLINEGQYDDFFRQWARDAAADGRRVLLRFGFECNGGWFSWSGDPAAYVAAFRRAREIFRAEDADNVEWVWCPNIQSAPDTPQNNMHLYYPGDNYVDWVGLDGYNFGDQHDEWHTWDSFSNIYREALPDFAARYGGKPMIIGEFGSAPGEAGQQPAWIREAYETLQRFPQVKAVVWFHYDKRREGEPDFRLDNKPESLRAFNETFARPHP